MLHDERCEAKAAIEKGWPPRYDCNCAQRAYARDPFLDEDGKPVPIRVN